MIKASSNKTEFAQAIRAIVKQSGGRPLSISRDGVFISLELTIAGAESFETLAICRTVDGAETTGEKWGRWFAEVQRELAAERDAARQAARVASGKPLVTDIMPQAEIEAWAAARVGWTVFYICARIEEGQITSYAEQRGALHSAGRDGHIFVTYAPSGQFGSFPLHLVANSGAKVGAVSTSDKGTLQGAPAMAYAVLDASNPDGVINDQLEAVECVVRAALLDQARAELDAMLATVSNLGAFLAPAIPTPSIRTTEGAFPASAWGEREGALFTKREHVVPKSGAKSYTVWDYTAPLPGWQDPILVRRQRDLLALALLELVECAEPGRDAAEIYRARDLLNQASKAGAPV